MSSITEHAQLIDSCTRLKDFQTTSTAECKLIHCLLFTFGEVLHAITTRAASYQRSLEITYRRDIMGARYDATVKSLVEAAPQDWLALCGHDIQSSVRIVDADLSTVTTMADKIVLIEEPEPWIAHFEFQSSYESGIALRLLRYNVLIEYRHQVPVQSILVLLRPESDGPAANGISRRSLPNGTCYYEFRFQVLRVWELPVKSLLQGKIGTLPLAPISDATEAELPAVIDFMASRVAGEIAPGQQGEFWASTAILMGTRFQFPLIDLLLQGVINMQESSVIQAFLQQGRDEGQAQEARKLILKTVRHRFGNLDDRLEDYVMGISDLEFLENLLVRVVDVVRWEELLP